MKKSVIVGGSAVAILAAALFFFVSTQLVSIQSADTITLTQTISIAQTSVRVAVADTPTLRSSGLSGYRGLAGDEGMLFIFEEDGMHSFWMKDMRFPIDILWISSDGRVVFIEKEVSPETFPKSFTPATPARYVLEVEAGFVEKHGIEIGDSTVF